MLKSNGGNKMKEKQNGFRDGIKKEDVLKLDDSEKEFIKEMRKAKEAERQNVAAFKLIVLSEQGRSSFEDLKLNVDDNIIKILSQDKEIKENKIDIMKGSTEKMYQDDIKLDIEDLKINNLNRKKIQHQYLQLLRSDLASLFQYIDAKGLDGEVYFKEEDYNELVGKVKTQMEEIGIELY